MHNETVTAILWTLVAVTLVLLFAALVTRAADESLWAHVEQPAATTTHTGPTH